MSDYLIHQTSRTASSVVVAGILAGQFLAGDANASQHCLKDFTLIQLPYHTRANQPSFDQISNVFSGEFGKADQFVEAVSKFYAKLLASQEPLGAEFERVLSDNLWALYEG